MLFIFPTIVTKEDDSWGSSSSVWFPTVCQSHCNCFRNTLELELFVDSIESLASLMAAPAHATEEAAPQKPWLNPGPWTVFHPIPTPFPKINRQTDKKPNSKCNEQWLAGTTRLRSLFLWTLFKFYFLSWGESTGTPAGSCLLLPELSWGDSHHLQKSGDRSIFDITLCSNALEPPNKARRISTFPSALAAAEKSESSNWCGGKSEL